MRNCLKSLLIIAVFVASSFVGVKGSAAAGPPSMGGVSLPGQANPANLMTGTWFSVDTPPITSVPGGPSWATNILNAEGEFYNNPNSPYYNTTPELFEVYTIACWDPMFDVVGSSTSWECSYFHSNPFAPNANENAVEAQHVIGTIGTTNYNLCSWLLPWDGSVCGAYDTNSQPGNASPAQSGNLIPNLDPYIGQTVNLYADENWCSALAPPNYDALDNWPSLALTGCYGNGSTVGIGLDARMLASSDGAPVVQKVQLSLQAGPTDCHVPKVKGLTLRKAKTRLRRANCGASVRYVKGKVAGRVRYQPLMVGTGKPRGYKVKLAVVR